jgi:hypothetical protein
MPKVVRPKPEFPELTAAASDLLEIALRFENQFGEAFDDEDEDSQINGGDAVEFICLMMPAIRAAIGKARRHPRRVAGQRRRARGRRKAG